MNFRIDNKNLPAYNTNKVIQILIVFKKTAVKNINNQKKGDYLCLRNF